jgi:hypothetical protein
VAIRRAPTAPKKQREFGLDLDRLAEAIIEKSDADGEWDDRATADLKESVKHLWQARTAKNGKPNSESEFANFKTELLRFENQLLRLIGHRHPAIQMYLVKDVISHAGAFTLQYFRPKPEYDADMEVFRQAIAICDRTSSPRSTDRLSLYLPCADKPALQQASKLFSSIVKSYEIEVAPTLKGGHRTEFMILFAIEMIHYKLTYFIWSLPKTKIAPLNDGLFDPRFATHNYNFERVIANAAHVAGYFLTEKQVRDRIKK